MNHDDTATAASWPAAPSPEDGAREPISPFGAAWLPQASLDERLVVTSPNGADRHPTPTRPTPAVRTPQVTAAADGAAVVPAAADGHKPPTVTVVVPTRNEAPNVEPLVSRIAAAFGPQDNRPATTWEVIFVDDSDDDTPATVRKLEACAPVRLLHRPPGSRPEGLGGAVLDGFAIARGSALVVMDADLQHPPELLPTLIQPLLAGHADLVAGTRYERSGATTGLAGPWRRAVSSGSRRLVHLVVRRSRCLSDPMSGLFALNRSVVDGIDLRPNGFKILLEVAARGRITRVHNVAYRFAERNAGASKASLAEGVRFVRHLYDLMRSGSELGKLPPITSSQGDSTDRTPSGQVPVVA